MLAWRAEVHFDYFALQMPYQDKVRCGMHIRNVFAVSVDHFDVTQRTVLSSDNDGFIHPGESVVKPFDVVQAQSIAAGFDVDKRHPAIYLINTNPSTPPLEEKIWAALKTAKNPHETTVAMESGIQVSIYPLGIDDMHIGSNTVACKVVRPFSPAGVCLWSILFADLQE